MTLIPTAIYFNDRGLAKVELGLAIGKKHYDKREDLKKREHQREMDRAVSKRRR
jgi:SsrA-binding protein